MPAFDIPTRLHSSAWQLLMYGLHVGMLSCRTDAVTAAQQRVSAHRIRGACRRPHGVCVRAARVDTAACCCCALSWSPASRPLSWSPGSRQCLTVTVLRGSTQQRGPYSMRVCVCVRVARVEPAGRWRAALSWSRRPLLSWSRPRLTVTVLRGSSRRVGVGFSLENARPSSLAFSGKYRAGPAGAGPDRQVPGPLFPILLEYT